MTKPQTEQKIAEAIEKSLKSFGFQSATRKCYTPKYGEGAYTIENWSAKTVGQFLSQDIASLLTASNREAVEAKNYAYWERNQLVGVLSRLYPSHLSRHDEADKSWEDNWRNIVCVHTPVGQATWHLEDGDMPMFAHLEKGDDHWDGHTTEQKYTRLAELKKLGNL